MSERKESDRRVATSISSNIVDDAISVHTTTSAITTRRSNRNRITSSQESSFDDSRNQKENLARKNIIPRMTSGNGHLGNSRKMSTMASNTNVASENTNDARNIEMTRKIMTQTKKNFIENTLPPVDIITNTGTQMMIQESINQIEPANADEADEMEPLAVNESINNMNMNLDCLDLVERVSEDITKRDLYAENNSSSSNVRAQGYSQQQLQQRDDISTSNSNIIDAVQVKETLSLLSLPYDTMHFIAAFLTPSDWKSLSIASVLANKVCKTVFRRVRLHGFRCATEVVSAWVRGEHADARELVALYVKNGVPIYPPCLGHTYHTLMWRMSVESREMEASPEQNSEEPQIQADPNQPSEAHASGMDRFYTDRYEARDRGLYYLSSLTYLEEKCLFWRYYLAESSSTGSNTRNRTVSAPPVDNSRGNGRNNNQPNRPADHPASRRAFLYRATAAAVAASMRNKSKISVKVHRHLANQHYMGQSTVSDEDATGSIPAGTISLSSDFFHDNGLLTEAAAAPNSINPSDSSSESRNDAQASDAQRASNGYTFQSHPVVNPFSLTLPTILPTQTTTASGDTMITDFILQVYSGNTNFPKYNQFKSHIDSFSRKLSDFLDIEKSSEGNFEECLLDFWDEFFPKTAGIHFFDKHTPVPRASTMQSFLTKPCPKAIGIVQCEIERIRRSPTSKRQSVKGRLFPTYEYRLFIRDRRSEDGIVDVTSLDGKSINNRSDTVLMTAKNRGKNHQSSNASSPSSAPKRGVNNYYLYKATEEDTYLHHQAISVSCTNDSTPKKEGTNQSSKSLKKYFEAPVELGRLQSNFIGTEFQIFSPSLNKQCCYINDPHVICSESEGETDIEARSVSPLRSRKNLHHADHQYNPSLIVHEAIPSNTLESSQCSGGSNSRRKSAGKLLRRRTSAGGAVWSANPLASRKNHRAIAIDDSTTTSNICSEPLVSLPPSHHEEEDGAITYTANLLGNRPRVMDVCIPKVNDDSTETEWRQYCRDNVVSETGGNGSNTRMLSVFKQLQERLNNPENESEVNTPEGTNPTHTTADNHGLLCLQNRPPWWNFELGAFVLNFGGRVSVASVKNFQLCDRNDQEHIMLQFGRIQGRHSFTMDFQYPLTAMQAFAIAISSLQSKISLG